MSLQLSEDELVLIYYALLNYRADEEERLSQIPLSAPGRDIILHNFKESNALLRKIKSALPHQTVSQLDKP